MAARSRGARTRRGHTVIRLQARVHGQVQGIGYRFYVRRQAAALGVRGYVRNLPDGSVEGVAEGERPGLEQLLRALERGPTGAVVEPLDLPLHPAEGPFGRF